MSTPKNLNAEPWAEFDEHLTESTVSVVPAEEEAAIEDALGLQMISIRLQRSLISQLKIVAEFHKVGYQPLIRDLLNRFVRSEIPIVLNELIKQKKDMLDKMQKEAAESGEVKIPAVDEFLSREARRKIA